jgi:hypothetical protein
LRPFIVLLMLSLFFMQGCSPEDHDRSALVQYEYLSETEGLSEEVKQWLDDSKLSEDAGIHSLSAEDGITYVHAAGYKKAKVAYIFEDIEGKLNENLKVTLLKGSSSDTTFIKISYDSGNCCDREIYDETDSESEFYDAPQ